MIKIERKEETNNREIDLFCEKFQFTATTIDVLNDHMREKHRIYECDQCNFNSSSNVGLKIQKTTIHPIIDLTKAQEETLIECDYCNLNFKEGELLNEHMRVKHRTLHCENVSLEQTVQLFSVNT